MCIGILQTIILEWVTMPSYKQSRFVLISVWVFSFQSPDVQESLSCFLHFHQRKLLYVYYAHRTARGSRKFRSFLHHHLEPESRCVLSTFEKPEKKQSRFFKYDMKQVLTRHLLWLPSEKGATKSPSSNSHRSQIQQFHRTTANKATVPKKQSQKLSFQESLQLSSQGLLQKRRQKCLFPCLYMEGVRLHTLQAST